MPLFTQLGLPDDCTFEFDVNPDPERFTEVGTAPVVTPPAVVETPVAPPAPAPDAPAAPADGTQPKE